MSRTLITLLLSLAPLAAAAAPADKAYRTQGDCDGFPAVALTTADGLCVGLVAEGLGHARGVAVVDDDVFVVDMVAWESRKGRLLKLAKGGRHAPQVVLRDLDQPNAVVRGPGRTLYVGVTGQVLQVDPYAADPAKSVRAWWWTACPARAAIRCQPGGGRGRRAVRQRGLGHRQLPPGRRQAARPEGGVPRDAGEPAARLGAALPGASHDVACQRAAAVCARPAQQHGDGGAARRAAGGRR